MPRQEILIATSKAALLLVNFILTLVVIVIWERLPSPSQLNEGLVRVVKDRKTVGGNMNILLILNNAAILFFLFQLF